MNELEKAISRIEIDFFESLDVRKLPGEGQNLFGMREDAILGFSFFFQPAAAASSRRADAALVPRIPR